MFNLKIKKKFEFHFQKKDYEKIVKLEQRIGYKSDIVHFFVYTILNFPRFFSAESGPSKVREIQNSVNKKCRISEL